MKLLLFLLVMLCCTEIVYSSECSSYTVLNSLDRSQRVTNNGNTKCDNSLTRGWYRFMGDAGIAMATSCVPVRHCGTAATGWMQGSHPTQAEGIVTRTVCYHWNSNCCIWNNNIRVINCGGFYVYELVQPPNCNLRYCGNGEKACSSSPCRNGGTCVDLQSRNKYYRCECPHGFIGQQCETNVTTTVTCGEEYMQINLTKRHFPGVDWRNLHLNDKSCRATITRNTMNLRTPLNGCGTIYREHNNKIAFWNEVSNGGRGHGPGNGSSCIKVVSAAPEYDEKLLTAPMRTTCLLDRSEKQTKKLKLENELKKGHPRRACLLLVDWLPLVEFSFSLPFSSRSRCYVIVAYLPT